MKEPLIKSGIDGPAYKDVYVYMKTHKFWQGWQYFVSLGHIEEGFWVSERTLIKRRKQHDTKVQKTHSKAEAC